MDDKIASFNCSPGHAKITIPIKDAKINPEDFQELMHKMAMPVTNLRCPECGKLLRFNHETECELIFYCIHCDMKVKAKKR